MGFPVAVDAIWQQLEARYGDLPPQLQRAARFVREHPQEVALTSLRGLAGRAGVSPGSMLRLAQALGFANWDAFQAPHRAWLTSGRAVGAFSGRADRLISESRRPGAGDLLLDAIARAEAANLAAALAPAGRPALHRAAAILAEAPALAVAGLRSCFPVAYGLHYALSLFTPRARLLTLLDDLHHLNPGDALVAISVAPYSRETVEMVRHAAQAGLRVIAIADRPLTPFSALAEVTLVAGNDSPAHIASPVGPLALAHALAALVLARAGEPALTTLRRREAMLDATVYLSAEDP